jgi:hypothetical protein
VAEIRVCAAVLLAVFSELKLRLPTLSAGWAVVKL